MTRAQTMVHRAMRAVFRRLPRGQEQAGTPGKTGILRVSP